MTSSVFLDFQLPNAPTWFYFSLFLAFAIFFRFQRPLALRNADLLGLFLFAPGLLLLQQAKADPAADAGSITVAYIWLMVASGCWLVRALIDLRLERRPLLHVNLTAAGLTCLSVGLAVGLTAVALKRSAAEQNAVGRQPPPLEHVQAQAVAVVAQTASHAAPPSELHYLCVRLLSLLCHAAVLAGLFVIGWRHYQDRATGIAMATLYLLLPYTAYHIDQLHHVWPSAFLIWACACYRRPLWSGMLLGIATGTSIFPLFLLPAWWSFYAGRGAVRFLIVYAGAVLLSVGITASVYWFDGLLLSHLASALYLWEWQPWRVPTTEGIWTAVHWAYRLPVFVVFMTLVLTTFFWPSPKNLAHLLACNAAIIIGLQFWHADCGGVYVLWYLPLLILMVCRPNLMLAEPPTAVGSLITSWKLWGSRRTNTTAAAQELAI